MLCLRTSETSESNWEIQKSQFQAFNLLMQNLSAGAGLGFDGYLSSKS